MRHHIIKRYSDTLQDFSRKELKDAMDNVTPEDEMKIAFQCVLDQENLLAEIEADMVALKNDKALCENRLEMAWEAVKAIMDANGVTEDRLPAMDGYDYKIYTPAPRTTLKVEADAVPDEWCKIERKPKIREMTQYFNDHDHPLPNWAKWELGESNLNYRIVKKKTFKGEE